MRGGCTRRSREVRAASCRHKSGNLARNCSRLLAAGSGPDFGECNRCQGRLGFPDGVQQRHRVQLDPILTQRRLHLHADRVVLHQPIAGCGGRAVPLDHPGAVPSFLHQLERRLEVVHVLSHRPVQVGHGLTGHRAGVAVMTDEVADHGAILLLDPGLVVLAWTLRIF